ncbi:hypothetical protein [Streptomyces shaanxiensis]
MTTYRSDGQHITAGAPFTEIRTTAENSDTLLDELWPTLPARLRIAAAVFTPGDLTGATIREASRPSG